MYIFSAGNKIKKNYSASEELTSCGSYSMQLTACNFCWQVSVWLMLTPRP